MAGLNAASWRDGLLALLPPSQALNTQPEGVLYRVLEALGAGLSRAQLRAMALVAQFDPLQADELLGDWERLYGLPDDCLLSSTELGARRRYVEFKRLQVGGASRAYFVSLLAQLGFAGASITEYRPMRATSACNSAINQGGWRHAWRVNLDSSANMLRSTTRSGCNVALRAWGDPGVQCLLRRYAPAHTVVRVGYTTEE